MTDSCSDTELGMGGVSGERELMPVKRELDQEEVFYKSVLVGNSLPGRDYITAGEWRDK